MDPIVSRSHIQSQHWLSQPLPNPEVPFGAISSVGPDTSMSQLQVMVLHCIKHPSGAVVVSPVVSEGQPVLSLFPGTQSHIHTMGKCKDCFCLESLSAPDRCLEEGSKF